MILNAFAVLDIFLSLVRSGLGLGVIWFGVQGLRNAGNGDTQQDDRFFLVFVLTVALLILNLTGWPLFYGVLQSYVPQWPGVMCIYGVTRIGTGSVGTSRLLPELLLSLQLLKPLLIFLSGAWLVVYLLNRTTTDARLIRPLLTLLVLCGVASVADAALESTYLVVPKREQFLEAGCCAASEQDLQAIVGSSTESEGIRRPVVAGTAFFGLTLLLALAMLRGSLKPYQPVMPLLLGALISLPLGLLFLIEVAAPTILSLPFHRCAYDLIPHAPECLPAVAAYLFGVFCVGWTCAVRGMGRRYGIDQLTSPLAVRLLFLGGIGYLASGVFFAVELLVS